MSAGYEALDAAIIDILKNYEKATFCEFQHCLRNEIAAATEPGKEEFRTLDRRLQALRKQGLINYKKGWRITQS